MGYDIGVFFCWGVAYRVQDLASYSRNRLGRLKSMLDLESFQRLKKFWRTKEGRAKQLGLLPRLDRFQRLREASEGLDDDEAESADAQAATLQDMLAESGCREIGVYAISSGRAYDEECQLDCIIVGFRPFASVIYNPTELKLDEFVVASSWTDELQRFTEFEGLPLDRSGRSGHYTPRWLMYVMQSDTVEFELRYGRFDENV